MLQKIHERVQGLIAWVLVTLIAITFAFWGISYYIESHDSDSGIAAYVNGEVITKTQFMDRYQRLKRETEYQLGENVALTPTIEKSLKAKALRELISNKVILQAAKNAGYLVTPEQAEQALLQFPEFQEDGQFSKEKFETAISSALYTPSVFLQEIEQGMLINQQRFALSGSAVALPSDMTRFVQLINQRRDFSYVLIKPTIFTPKASTLQEETSYYQKHHTQFTTKEQVKIQYLALSMKAIMDALKISPQMLQNYYEQNKDNYMKPASFQIAHILIRTSEQVKSKEALQKAWSIKKRIENGESFENMAKQYSQDPETAALGGMIPRTENSFGRAFDAALMDLKPHEVSAPVKTPNGYEIIRLIAYEKPIPIPFNTAKEDIAQVLKAEKAQKIFSSQSDTLTDLTYQNPTSLERTAKKMRLPLQKSDFFTDQGLKTGIASKKMVVHAAFSEDVLLQGNNSEPLQLDDDTLLVLRVKDRRPARQLAFKAVQKNIQQILKAQKTKDLARTSGEKIVSQLNQGQSVESLLKTHALQWVQEKAAMRHMRRLSPVILKHAFALPRPNGKNIVSGFALKNGDYVIITLEKVRNGTLSSANAEQRKIFTNELEAAFGILDYNLYVQGLMKTAKIKKS